MHNNFFYFDACKINSKYNLYEGNVMTMFSFEFRDNINGQTYAFVNFNFNFFNLKNLINMFKFN